MADIEFDNWPDMDTDIRLALTMVYEKRKNLTPQERLAIAYDALTYAKENHKPEKGKLSTYMRFAVMKTLNEYDKIDKSVVSVPNGKRSNIITGELYENEIPHVREDWDMDSTDVEIDMVNRAIIDHLSEKHAYITYVYYTGAMKLDEIGLVMGMSRQRVHQIATRSAEKIRERIEDFM